MDKTEALGGDWAFQSHPTPDPGLLHPVPSFFLLSQGLWGMTGHLSPKELCPSAL